MAAGTPESGTGDDQVRLRRGLLARQLPAQRLARLVHAGAEEHGVGRGEVDVLEDAAARGRVGAKGCSGAGPARRSTTISPGSTSRMYSASIRSSAVVSLAST